MSEKKKPTLDELEAARQARNAYARAWRKANPERVKAIEARYWLKKTQGGGVRE